MSKQNLLYEKALKITRENLKLLDAEPQTHEKEDEEEE